MTKNDYIEKITQNLEHLTKDELKDVSILTTAQYGVRMKVAEKEYIEKEIANLTPQLQQQALPVVPEYVAEFIEDCKKEGDCLFGVFADATRVEHDMPDLVYFWLGDEGNNDELFARAWLDGYTVEKPQLFYLRDELTGQFLAKNNQFKNEDRYFFWNGEDPLTHSIGTAWKLTFTQQEIDSMETGSYELVPVEDGE